MLALASARAWKGRLTQRDLGRKILSVLGVAAAAGWYFWAAPTQLPGKRLQASGAESLAEMPAALRMAYLQDRQQQGGSAHAFQLAAGQPKALVAQSAKQGLESTLDENGLRLRSIHRPSSPAASLTLTSLGCAAAPRAAEATPPITTANGQRVEYRRDGVTEWYLNGPLGLEHGFTVERDPDCGTDKTLAFSLSLNGQLAASLVTRDAGARIELRDPTAGEAVLAYSGLFAVDAAGKALAARMAVEGRTLRLEVDAAGARYPVTVDPTWTEQAKLVSSDGAASDSFSSSMWVDGDTAVIGAPNHAVGGNMSQGEAYVYVRSGTTWTEQAKLVASDGAASGFFGGAIAVSGDTVVIGPGFNLSGSRTGQVYVFVRSGTQWTEQAKLTPSDAPIASFGLGVSVSGNTVVIGAAKQKVGANLNQGQAYVYVRAGTTWTEQAKLTASDGAADDFLGVAVSVSNDTALIGAAASNAGAQQAYVYVRSGTTWTEQAKLATAKGALGIGFGNSVSVSGDTALVSTATQAYVFARSGTTWTNQATLTPSAGITASNSKIPVALSGNVAVLSGPGSQNAYVFIRNGTTWTEDTKLTASDSAAGDTYGSTVALTGYTVVVAANTKTVGGNAQQGQAYVYSAPAPAGIACSSGAQCSSTFCVDGVCCNGACGGGMTASCQACLAQRTGGTDGTCAAITVNPSPSCLNNTAPDGGTTPDGGIVPGMYRLSGGGCNCNVTPTAASGAGMFTMLSLALLAALRRRRAR